MTAERVAGVLLTLDDAAYLADALRVFATLASERGSKLTPRVLALREALAQAAAESDDDARTSESQHDWMALSAHDLLDSTEAARRLGCTPGNVRDLARRGALPAHRNGRQWLYPAEAVELRAARTA